MLTLHNATVPGFPNFGVTVGAPAPFGTGQDSVTVSAQNGIATFNNLSVDVATVFATYYNSSGQCRRRDRHW